MPFLVSGISYRPSDLWNKRNYLGHHKSKIVSLKMFMVTYTKAYEYWDFFNKIYLLYFMLT